MDEDFNLICNDVGVRVDTFIADALMGAVTRSEIQNLIVEGKVTVNGKPVAKNYKTRLNDAIWVENATKVDETPQGKEIPLEILYEDSGLLVIDKPRGMVVHPGAGKEKDTLVNALLFHCKKENLSDLNGNQRPGIVHRIDKDTSGLLVVAKNNVVHEGLSAQFEAHSIKRTYFAVAVGHFKNFNGTVNAPLGRNAIDRKKMCITEKNSKQAVTHYEVLEEYKDYSFIKLNLETGRTHQIRVHMASINHPIAGDEIYGLKKGIRMGGQCLHAGELGFVHPETGEEMFFKSPLPPYFEEFIAKLRRESL